MILINLLLRLLLCKAEIHGPRREHFSLFVDPAWPSGHLIEFSYFSRHAWQCNCTQRTNYEPNDSLGWIHLNWILLNNNPATEWAITHLLELSNLSSKMPINLLVMYYLLPSDLRSGTCPWTQSHDVGYSPGQLGPFQSQYLWIYVHFGHWSGFKHVLKVQCQCSRWLALNFVVDGHVVHHTLMQEMTVWCSVTVLQWTVWHFWKSAFILMESYSMVVKRLKRPGTGGNSKPRSVQL